MDLQGWDTVYVVDLSVANRALATSLSQLIPRVQHTLSGQLGTYAVDATFSEWQITTGGSGQLINLQTTIGSGSVTPSGGTAISLNGLVAQFSLALRFLPTSTNTQVLGFDMQSAGTVGQAPTRGMVVPIGFIGAAPDPSVAAVALNALAAGLVERAPQISFALATINLVPPTTNSWLAPKNLAYSFGTTHAGQSFLAILSTAGDPAALTPVVDPGVMPHDAAAAFAFSLPLYFRNCVIPSIANRLPDDPCGAFSVANTAPPQVSLVRGVSFSGVRVGAINYYPSMSAFNATPSQAEMSVSASGDCDVYMGLSMSWSVGHTVSHFTFNKDAQTIGFASTGAPSVDHHVSVPWYWWALAPMIAGIADGVASLIGNDIADYVGGQVSGLMSAAPPQSVQFAGMRQFVASNAAFDNAVVLTGSPA